MKLSFIFKFIIITITLLITFFPIYWMFSLSIRADVEFLGVINFLPQTFTLDNFIALFDDYDFFLTLSNSLIVTLFAVCLSLFLGVPSAYILSNKRFNISFAVMVLVLVLLIRIVPPITLALPLYIMMNKIGILNTKIPIILAHILVCLPFLIWYMTLAFRAIPNELIQSAKIDGASEWKIFTNINLPLVKTSIIAITIFSFVSSWNEYLYSMIFIQSPDNFTIPITLATFNSEQELTQWGMVASGGIVSTLPIAIFMVLLQKFLMRDLSRGAVKG